MRLNAAVHWPLVSICAAGLGLPNLISVVPTWPILSSILWMWCKELKTVSMSMLSPLTSASHSELGNPAGAVEAHLIHLLTVVGSLWKISRMFLVLLQLGFVFDLLTRCSALNH